MGVPNETKAMGDGLGWANLQIEPPFDVEAIATGMFGGGNNSNGTASGARNNLCSAG